MFKDLTTRKQRLNKSNSLNFIQALVGFILTIIVAILAIDFIGFVAWALSGQTPQDSFFIGAITNNFIK